MPNSKDWIRNLRETCQVLLAHLRCVSMKRALACTERDQLNFFRLYDGCLLDCAVISWCKVLGSDSEFHGGPLNPTHWKHLTGESLHDKVRAALYSAVGGEDEFMQCWREANDYRNQALAHHRLTVPRPATYPDLEPMRATAMVLYREFHEDLEQVSSADGLPEPDRIDGDNRLRIESAWREMCDRARAALAGCREP